MDDTSPPPYAIDDPSSPPRAPQFTRDADKDAAHHQRLRRTSDRLYVSGAPYFVMRPPKPAKHVGIMHYYMVFWPGATLDQIPFPQPVRNMWERDVDNQDWATFVNHLLSNYDANGGRQTEDTMPFRDEKSQDGSLPQDKSPESKFPEQDYLQEVITEWNEAFFIPRGLKIVLAVHASVPSTIFDNSWKWVPFQSEEKDRKNLGKALHKAISRRDMALTKLLLDAGADVNARPMCGIPSLTCAVKQGNSALVQMLLEKGPDLEATAPAAPTALYEAVTKGESELVALLLRGGANANAKPPGGEPALYRAASRGRLDMVKLLLDGGAGVDGTPPGGTTALYNAAKNNNLPLMRLLLEGKANVETRPPGGAPALHRAVSSGNCDVVKLLLEHGANINARPPGGDSALEHAVSRGDLELVRLLLGQAA